MPPFDGGFCASLFASQDPVAIDSVGADFLMNEPNMTSRNTALDGNDGVENYLHEAALAGKAPSAHATRTATADKSIHSAYTNTGITHSINATGATSAKKEGIELLRV